MEVEQYDRVEELPCGSLIQHGPLNDRIYLMRPGEHCSSELPYKLISMAEARCYTKIFAKVPSHMAGAFIEAGFVVEARIPGFYNGTFTGVFLAYCLTEDRACESCIQKYENNILLALDKKDEGASPLDSDRFSLRPCSGNDIDQMVEIYKTVFPSYPFPIHDPEYIYETMQSHVDYFCVESEDAIVALSSIEMDARSSNVEMTDFATLPEWRGHGFGVHLLSEMETEVRKRNIDTSYTIARAASPGMNITFSRLGYAYAGRLKNNTNISGDIESMNVWYKPIED